MKMVETTDTEIFLGLLLDEDLLQAEFDAIIAAEYPAPRPPRITSPMRCRRARLVSRHSKSGKLQATAATPVGGPEGPGRGRSPPPAAITPTK